MKTQDLQAADRKKGPNIPSSEVREPQRKVQVSDHISCPLMIQGQPSKEPLRETIPTETWMDFVHSTDRELSDGANANRFHMSVVYTGPFKRQCT